MNIPPKVKHFIWRAYRNCLPTRSNLAAKNIQVDTICVFCHIDIETCWHLFVTCSFCTNCWNIAGLKDWVERWVAEAESFQDFVEYGINNSDSYLAAKFCVILWSLWRQRNCEVWEQKHLAATGTVHSALCILTDWGNNGIREQTGDDEISAVQIHQWRKPDFPYLKCNVDAAFCQNRKCTGIGMILRNDQGELVVARTMCFPGLYYVREAEAMGVREALSWIYGLGIQQVVVETDAKYVVDGLSSLEKGMTEYDSILQECRVLLHSEPAFSVDFVRRSANKVAHELAKESFSFDSPSVWSSPPLCIVNSLSVDALH
ncbi:hypothetical protein DH2020_014440 [Rehmannia glutinosa]|uniref:Uncharacterized protein n=1 Tax=Rehmannia glutinosa TaxID=99300 RepID=A0ABR0WX50_REHGL